MNNFINWLAEKDKDLYEWYATIGHPDEWGDPNTLDDRYNSSKFRIRGIRSKYTAYMKDNKPKRKKKNG